METYNNFISHFEIFENPPKKEGFHRHHIVPECLQKKLYGQVIDNRQIYVTQAQHLWAHILYDREHSTNSANRLLTICGKPADYFDCWEKCLAYSYTLIKKADIGKKKSAEVVRTLEVRKKQSESHKGERNSCYGRTGDKNPMYGVHRYGKEAPFYGQCHSEEYKRQQAERMRGKHWFTNGIKNVFDFECPEGFWKGMTTKVYTLRKCN